MSFLIIIINTAAKQLSRYAGVIGANNLLYYYNMFSKRQAKFMESSKLDNNNVYF